MRLLSLLAGTICNTNRDNQLDLCQADDTRTRIIFFDTENYPQMLCE